MAPNSKLFLLVCMASVVTVSLWMAASSRSLSAATPQAQDPQQVFLDKCSVCHGEDGAGKTAKGRKVKVKDVRSPEVQKMTDAEFTDIILSGKGENMAPFEKELGKEMCQKLAVYMRGLAKK